MSQQDEAVETRRIEVKAINKALPNYSQIFVGDDMTEKDKKHLQIVSQNTGSWSPQSNFEKLHEHVEEFRAMDADVYLFQEIGINSHHPRMKNDIKKAIKHQIKQTSIHLK